MRNLILIGGVCIAAVVIGVGLFFFGPASLRSDINNALLSGQIGSGATKFTVLAQGTQAVSINSRTNYRITSADDLAALWPIVYGERDAPHVPAVDFSRYEVLAVFDGTHSSTGYNVQVTSVIDKTPTRMVLIDHLTPSPTCKGVNKLTNPFQIIEVPKTTYTLTHQDIVSTSTCSSN